MQLEDELREYFRYDPGSGKIYWRKRKGPRRAPGEEAGYLQKGGGYWHIRFNRKGILGHRVAWFLYYSYWPKEIDHINGVKNDNRIDNLREVSRRDNCCNRREHREGRLVGASRNGGKWEARIKIGGRTKHLGHFNTEAEAHEAYMKARRKL